MLIAAAEALQEAIRDARWRGVLVTTVCLDVPAEPAIPLLSGSDGSRWRDAFEKTLAKAKSRAGDSSLAGWRSAAAAEVKIETARVVSLPGDEARAAAMMEASAAQRERSDRHTARQSARKLTP